MKMNLTKALQNIEIILRPPPPFEQFLKDIRFFLQKAFLSLTDARELKFCVCYLRIKSATLTNLQPNWITRSKVSNFICSLS